MKNLDTTFNDLFKNINLNELKNKITETPNEKSIINNEIIKDIVQENQFYSRDIQQKKPKFLCFRNSAM